MMIIYDQVVEMWTRHHVYVLSSFKWTAIVVVVREEGEEKKRNCNVLTKL